MTGNEPLPRMARSWWLGCEAWIVSLGAFVVALLGVLVTHLMSTPVMAAVLLPPLVIAGFVAAFEWWTARGHGLVLHPMHLLGIVLGLVTWLIYQRAPGDLPFNPSVADLCRYVGRDNDPECLTSAGPPRSHAEIAWWITGALILALTPLARRSRTAAWSAAAFAFAGSGFALHFLELFVKANGG